WILSSRSATCRKPKAIIPTSASAGAGRRSLGRRRRSKVCTRTTSSWQRRRTICLEAVEALSLWGERRCSTNLKGFAPMERRKASDSPPEVLKLFEGYSHGLLSRRDFLDSAAKYAVGSFTAAAMLQSLGPNYAWGQQVARDDQRIRTDYLTYDSPQGSGTIR